MQTLDMRIDDIPDPGAREFTWQGHALFLVHFQQRWYVYRNYCPHLGISLNFMPDAFFDSEGRHLICANHGALFQVEDGRCIAGPCYLERLSAIPHRIENQQLWIDTCAL